MAVPGTMLAIIARYLALGYQTFILDIPPNEEELRCIGKVFALAREQAALCNNAGGIRP